MALLAPDCVPQIQQELHFAYILMFQKEVLHAIHYGASVFFFLPKYTIPIAIAVSVASGRLTVPDGVFMPIATNSE